MGRAQREKERRRFERSDEGRLVARLLSHQEWAARHYPEVALGARSPPCAPC